MMKLSIKSQGGLFLAFCLLGATANAGDVLRLRQGDVKTTVSDQGLHARNVVTSQDTRYFLVQFKAKITASDQAFLQAQGMRIYQYFPEDALLVKSVSGNLSAVQKSPRVQAVVPFAKEWRVSPDIESASVFNRDKVDAFIVRLTADDELKSVQSTLQKMTNVTVLSAEGSTLLVRVPHSAVDVVAAVDGVLWVQANVKMQTFAVPFDEANTTETPPSPGDFTDLTGKESGTVVMNFTAAWDRGYTGTGQIASMADTGLDTGDKATLAKDFGNLKEGQVFGMFSQSWGDPMGHGTHVAGSIMSAGVGSNGFTKGGAYSAGFVAQSMWSPMLENLTVPPQLGGMFQKAYDAGARVHSNSWGSPRDLGAYDSFAQQVDEFMWKHPDMLILFAAGNSGDDKNKDGRIDEGSVSSPATAKNALSVGASENLVSKGGIQAKLSELRVGKEKWGTEPLASDRLSDNINGVAAFSSRGPTQDGRLKPEVVAPGTNILSNCSHEPGAEVLWGKYNNDYCFSGGTSMATPLTAGGATVAREYLVKAKNIANPSAALVKNALMHAASDMFPGQFGEVGAAHGQELLVHRPDNHQGFGRVDMDKVTQLEGSVVVDEVVGVKQGQSQTYQVQVGASGALLATLVYTDAPGAPNASKALVNDLDLQVTGPNGFNQAPQDRKNNSEILELKGLAPGAYTVTVQGASVPQGNNGAQPYSLIISAGQ